MDVISSSTSVPAQVNSTDLVAETISTNNSEEDISLNTNSVPESEESQDITSEFVKVSDIINNKHSVVEENSIGKVENNITKEKVDEDIKNNTNTGNDECVSNKIDLECNNISDLKNNSESEPNLEVKSETLDSTHNNFINNTNKEKEDNISEHVEEKEISKSPEIKDVRLNLKEDSQTPSNNNKDDVRPENDTAELSGTIPSEVKTTSSEVETTLPEIETTSFEIQSTPSEIKTASSEIETAPSEPSEIDTVPSELSEIETAPSEPSEIETALPEIESLSLDTETIVEQKVFEEITVDNECLKEQVEDTLKDDEKIIIVTDVDVHAEDIPETDEINQLNDTLSEVDDQVDQDLQENPVFVHVSSKADGESDLTEADKTLNSDSHIETGDEEDPIGINQETDKDNLIDYAEEVEGKESIKVVDFGDETTSDKPDDDLVASKGADEELCIIPDTEREISQEEKDAATAAAAAAAELPRPAEESTVTINDTVDNVSQQLVGETVENSLDKLENSVEENAQSTIDEEFMASVNNTSASKIIEKPEIKVTEISEEEATEETCHQCSVVRKCLYKVDSQENATFICSETCLISFRTLNKPPLATLKGTAELKLKTIYRTTPDLDASKIFIRKCGECSQKIKQDHEKVLSWETMEFCNEDCLSKYQNRIGSHCANCKKTVLMSSLGKYCVRFGHDIRQFCCSGCLEEFKKGLKVCSYCQKDISSGTEGFLAPVGDKGQFKDFCSQLCMEKYDQLNKNTNNKNQLPVDISQCAVCDNAKQIQVNFEQNKNRKHKFCSYPCFVAFRFVNQIEPFQCDMCKNYFDNDNCIEFSIYYEKIVKNFCCKTCQNIYIIANRKIVPCSWCKVKKYNFDMIKRSCNNGQILMMCSLNCLSLFQVSVNAVSFRSLKCDFCAQITQAQYHLTMSDATIRNFCTYHCVMSFQSHYAKLPITLEHGDKSGNKPVPAGGPKKYSNRGSRSSNTGNDTSSINEIRMPVITNVESLADKSDSDQSSSNSIKANSQQTLSQLEPAPKVQIKQQVIVKAPPLPSMKNVMTTCKPLMFTKSISCKPNLATKETQTEELKEKTVIVPVPVPMYIPAPLHMYSAPVPVPIPFPLPIPVPVFIPTTRNSAAGIMKEIKKIQVKIPTDPFEAELLMMAEMVAGEKKVDNTDSESEEDDNGDPGADGGFSPEAVDTSNTFGDDMLQMALKMATELDEPAVDLEGALTANTITASQNQDNTVVATEEAVDDPQPIHPMMDRQAIRGRKRTNRQPRNINNPAKRGRRLSSHVEMPLLPPPQSSQPPEPIEKPDANMCLKYTFGVNAWKQWVTTKNAELEKSSRRVKLFKNEILQLTADELNYSLCLFVKEVRKPNGTEYAPDTIYYLCLGIQQYLFENGRIDNIFTDAYYEKFTDCLDEVARKFSVLYNDSHYIVTRVEEEHLWESKQLGAHSPHVLLSTLMFFNTKHFNLTTVDEHMQLSFSHIMKHWKRNPNQPGAAKIPGSRNVLLRFYPPQTSLESNSRKKKVYEQQENEENPLRCPVKLYEFYLSKCPESVKTRNDVFYLLPERSCVPDSPVWYSTMALGREALEKMLHRVKMVKEINVALLTRNGEVVPLKEIN